MSPFEGAARGRKISLAVNALLIATSLAYFACYDAFLAGFAPLAATAFGVPDFMGKTGIALSAALFACSGVLFSSLSER